MNFFKTQIFTNICFTVQWLYSNFHNTHKSKYQDHYIYHELRDIHLVSAETDAFFDLKYVRLYGQQVLFKDLLYSCHSNFFLMLLFLLVFFCIQKCWTDSQFLQLFYKISILMHLEEYITATNKFTIEVHLWDGRPVGVVFYSPTQRCGLKDMGLAPILTSSRNWKNTSLFTPNKKTWLSINYKNEKYWKTLRTVYFQLYFPEGL